jgi:hypothetical protein
MNRDYLPHRLLGKGPKQRFLIFPNSLPVKPNLTISNFIFIRGKLHLGVETSSAGFSLRGFEFACIKPRRLKPVLLKTDAARHRDPWLAKLLSVLLQAANVIRQIRHAARHRKNVSAKDEPDCDVGRHQKI